MKIDGTALLLIFLTVFALVAFRLHKLRWAHAPEVDTGSVGSDRPSPAVPTTLDEASQCLINDWMKNHPNGF